MQRKLNPMILIDILLCLVCFFIVVIGTQKYGPGLSHDSAAYLYTAKSLAAGNGLQYFAYTSPFMQWPPLFPALLSMAEFFKIDALQLSRFANALFMAGAVFVSALTLRRSTKNAFIPTVFALLAIVSFPLIKMSFYLWSEPLFILVTALVFHILLTSDLNDKWVKPVAAMGVLTALACLTRYVGVFVIISVCLYLFIVIKGFMQKIKIVFIYGLISALPTLLYIVRNYIASQTLVGMRSPSGISFMTNVGRAAKTLSGWLFPVTLEQGGVSKLTLVLMGLIGILFAIWFIAVILKGDKKRPAVLFLAFYCMLYTLQMIISATNVAFDAISDRYMIPVFVPLLVLILFIYEGVVEKARESSPSRITRLLRILSAILFSSYLLYYAVSNGEITKTSVDNAINTGAGGYNSDYWQQHPVRKDLEALSDSDMMYSNNPEAIYFLSRKPIHYMPKLFGIPMYGYEAFLKESADYQKQYIVWFGEEKSKIVYTPQQLENDFMLTELIRRNSYVIYQMEKED